MSDALVRLRPRREEGGDTASWRLVACPPSGAGAGFFRPFIAPDVELWSLRYPGRESRIGEPYAASLQAIADEAAPLIADLRRDDLPTVVLGHSMGVGVALEITGRLVEAGRAPALLVLSARSAEESRSEAAELERVAATDGGLTSWVESLGGVPTELLDDPDFMAMHLRTLRADLRISLRHRPAAATWPVPLLLVCGDADPAVDIGRMRAWGEFTSAGVAELTLPGGHQAIVEHRDTLLDAIRSHGFATLGPSTDGVSRRFVSERQETPGVGGDGGLETRPFSINGGQIS